MSDDIIYALVFLLSLPLGALLPSLRPGVRGGVAGAAGAALTIAACGGWALYSLCSVLLSYAVLRVAPRRLHGPLCFAGAFVCLGALRLFATPPGPANAVQLVATLRLASLGFDSADSTLQAEGDPSLLLLLQYAFCYHGLFSGPFYRFVEWARVMRSPRSAVAPTADARALAGRALLSALATLAVWRAVAAYLPYKYMTADDGAWRSLPPLPRLAYFYLSSFQQRYRFYACWSLLEAAGALARFPSPANVDPIACETATSPSALIAGERPALALDWFPISGVSCT